MNAITSTTDIATCVVFALNGPGKIRADDISGDETVTLYEERVDGDYEPYRANGNQVKLIATQPSLNVELYGNFKALKSSDTIGDVGYEV
ncbi:MAG TPA: hypothetical protein DEB35_10040 [Desulfuromonas sp.]|nr:hypothetical protein [Desulfuromonas sp.]